MNETLSILERLQREFVSSLPYIRCKFHSADLRIKCRFKSGRCNKFHPRLVHVWCWRCHFDNYVKFKKELEDE